MFCLLFVLVFITYALATYLFLFLLQCAIQLLSSRFAYCSPFFWYLTSSQIFSVVLRNNSWVQQKRYLLLYFEYKRGISYITEEFLFDHMLNAIVASLLLHSRLHISKLKITVGLSMYSTRKFCFDRLVFFSGAIPRISLLLLRGRPRQLDNSVSIIFF